MSDFTTLTLAIDGPTARLTLARPERLNALSARTQQERQTKQLVNALVEDAHPTRQSFRDADITLAALHDEESRATMRRYLQSHGRDR